MLGRRNVSIIAENNKVCNVTKSLNNLTISLACTLDGCTTDKTNYMLECSNCRRLTHYACTKLPAYQIQLFLLKGYRLYKCSMCVGGIHKDIHENCVLESNSDEVNQPKKLVEETPNLLTAASTQTDIQMDKCSSSSSEELLTHKVRYLEKELQICNKRLAKYQKAECEKNMKTISVQTTNSISEAYDKLSDIEQINENHGNNNVLTDNLLTKLISEGFNKIEENIDRLITKKIAENSKEVEQIKANINEALAKNNSYADKLKSKLDVNSFAAVIQTNKNDDLIQERERERA